MKYPVNTDVVAEGLAKQYPGGVWGLVDASFTANTGSVTVLLGPNGAGKTTTIRILSTLLKPTRGRALVAGYDVVREAWEVRRRIALMPQEARMDMNWTPMEAVKWYLVARGWSLRDAEKEARRWLEELGLWEARNRSGWRLSGGQRRKVVVAMVLATGAEVVFLDEPTEELDVESRYAVWSAVRSYARTGRTVIFTTHNMREAEMLADQVVMISRGRVIAAGSPERLVSSLPYRYRVVARGARRVPRDGVRVGDTYILYTATRGEAYALASEVEAASIVVEEVSLEDAYLYYTKTMKGEG